MPIIDDVAEVWVSILILFEVVLLKKRYKGAWRMPRLTEAMKDVISCDKLRVGANNL